MQRGKTPPMNVLYDAKQSDDEAPVMQELGNAEYLFIAITPRSIIAKSGSTW